MPNGRPPSVLRGTGGGFIVGRFGKNLARFGKIWRALPSPHPSVYKGFYPSLGNLANFSKKNLYRAETVRTYCREKVLDVVAKLPICREDTGSVCLIGMVYLGMTSTESTTMTEPIAPEPASEPVPTPEPEPIVQPTKEDVIEAIEAQITYISSLTPETEFEAEGLTSVMDTLTTDLELLKAF